MKHIAVALGLLFFSPAYAAVEANLISTVAGQVGDEFLTSREVLLHSFVESVIAGRAAAMKISPESVRTREFAREATAALIESAVAMEADGFGSTDLDQKDLEELRVKVTRAIRAHNVIRGLEFDTREIDKVLKRKMKSRQFIRFKMSSSEIPVSDREAREYFEQNRLKFESLPFEHFKENIKSFLAKQQMDRRLRDWFELLQSRYRVRNHLAE